MALIAQNWNEAIDPAMMPAAGHDAETAAVIDRGHLARMTFGDRSLETEVLQLFNRQAALLIDRMRAGDSATVGALAHTLKGSAVGIGAGGVARAATATELAAGGSPSDMSRAIDQLAEAVQRARSLIAELLNRA